ncbi:MAG: hypothetical protein ACXVCY_12855 [Pseudobdellovibrionaceae bacterium]
MAQVDPFSDLSKLKISQNFTETIGVKKALLHVPVRKPNRQEFVRVHPNENMRLEVAMIEWQEDKDREIFLVAPEVASQLPNEVKAKLLVTAINRQNHVFLWPLGLDLEETRSRKNHWYETARTAADMATRNWVRVAANMNLGSYEVFEAQVEMPEPEWPTYSFSELLKIALKDNFIDSAEHIVIRKLLGAI